MPTMWVVLLEVEGSAGERMELAVARGILSAIADDHPTGLYSPDRVAFQASVRAMTPIEALESATARWLAAARRSGVRGWDVVRAEVLTPEEFERDCDEPEVPAEATSLALGRRVVTPPDAQEEELLRRAFHDSLTQLADRELFRSQVEHALVRSQPPDSVVAVLVFDLDEFRWVNRSAAPRVGDDVLVAVAQRIASRVRPGDTAARVGGDQFAVLLENTSRSSALLVAERILEAIRSPHDLDGREIVVTASLGVAFGPPADQGDELIRNAEAAMRSAKKLGGGRFAIFGPDAGHGTGSLVPAPCRRPEMIAYVRLLERATAVANECETLEEAAAIVLEQICTHTGWPIGQLHLRELQDPQSTKTVLRIATRERRESVRLGTPTPGGDAGLASQVVATKQPTWRREETEGGSSGGIAGAGSVEIKGRLAVPVLAGCEVAAVLEFLADHEPEPDPSVVEVVSSIGVQLGRIVERNRASAALAAGEARLRALVEASCDLMAVVGGDGRVVSHYEAAGARARPSGDSHELLDRIHPEDLQTASAHLDAARAAPGTSMRFRCRLRDGDGAWAPMEFVATGLLDDPAVRGIVLRGNYVAESKDTFGPAYEKHGFARLGTWRVDVPTGRTTWSEEMYAIFGLSPEDAVADRQMLLASIHPDDRARVADAMDQPARSEEPVSVEFRIVRPDGGVRWVQGMGSSVHDNSGQVVAKHGIVLDITERKDEEEALAASKGRWGDVLRKSAEILTLVGADGSVLLSLAPEGGPFAPTAQWGERIRLIDLVHPDDSGRMLSLIEEVTSRPGPVGPVGLRVRCADGSWRHVESVAENLLEDPVVRAIVVNSRDVTKLLEGLAEGTYADGRRALRTGTTAADPTLPARPTFAHR